MRKIEGYCTPDKTSGKPRLSKAQWRMQRFNRRVFECRLARDLDRVDNMAVLTNVMKRALSRLCRLSAKIRKRNGNLDRCYWVHGWLEQIPTGRGPLPRTYTLFHPF